MANEVIYTFEVWVVGYPGKPPAMKLGIAQNPREMIDKAEQFLKDDDQPDATVVGVKQIGEVEIK